MRRAALVVTLTAALALTAACGDGGDDAVVTVTRQVVATPPQVTQPQVTAPGGDAGATPVDPPASHNGGPASPTAGRPSASGGDGSGTDGGTTGPGSRPDTGQPTGGSSPAGSTDDRDTGSGPSSSGGSAVPTANDPDVGRDVPGPDSGPACPTNNSYVDEEPTGLRPDVIAAWRSVEKHANADGIIVCLNDGKRSAAQQQAQYDAYVEQYGKQAADQLVLTPDKSAHVTGTAIDVQPAEAYRWLIATEGSLGLCRIYDNEPWHFEYDVSYFTDGCPPRLPRPEH